jgi:hypothetical protein
MFRWFGRYARYPEFSTLIGRKFHQTVSVSLEDENFVALLKRLASLFPALLLIVYFTNKYSSSRYMQALFALVSTVFGVKNLQLITSHGTFGEMMQTPGLGTIWAYVLMQMNLSLACVSLFSVCVLYYGLKFYRQLEETPN